MRSYNASVNPGATREEGDGTKDNGDSPSLVDTVEPAVSGSDDSTGTQHWTTAYTASGQTNNVDD